LNKGKFVETDKSIFCPSSKVGRTNHAVFLVGYEIENPLTKDKKGIDEKNDKAYVKLTFKNSWGTYWCDEGFFTVRIKLIDDMTVESIINNAAEANHNFCGITAYGFKTARVNIGDKGYDFWTG